MYIKLPFLSTNVRFLTEFDIMIAKGKGVCYA